MESHGSQDTKNLRIPSRLVPPGMESHGSRDTKYPRTVRIPRPVPSSPARHAWSHMDPEILSIPGQSQVVCQGSSPGSSQVLIRKNTHISQYLVSWETQDDPELSQSGIKNKHYSCSIQYYYWRYFVWLTINDKFLPPTPWSGRI